MYKLCLNCHSTNIKKNGHTYYGKQNHQCICCGRQFVLNNKHTKSEWLKTTIKKALKERLSLRAICRTFIPAKQHKVGKDLTFYIEGFNATIRARVSRLVRKSLSFSKLDEWHDLAIGWFF